MSLMTADAVGFLVLGLFFSGCIAWGFYSGTMPSQYILERGGKHPGFFWMAGALNALLASVFLIAAWANS